MPQAQDPMHAYDAHLKGAGKSPFIKALVRKDVFPDGRMAANAITILRMLGMEPKSLQERLAAHDAQEGVDYLEYAHPESYPPDAPPEVFISMPLAVAICYTAHPDVREAVLAQLRIEPDAPEETNPPIAWFNDNVATVCLPSYACDFDGRLERVIMAADLYAALELEGLDFGTWFGYRVSQFKFKGGEDYTEQGNNIAITLPMAMVLAAVETKRPNGRQVYRALHIHAFNLDRARRDPPPYLAEPVTLRLEPEAASTSFGGEPAILTGKRFFFEVGCAAQPQDAA